MGAFMAAIAFATGAVAVVNPGTEPGPGSSVALCHPTSSSENPGVPLEVASAAAEEGHEGDAVGDCAPASASSPESACPTTQPSAAPVAPQPEAAPDAQEAVALDAAAALPEMCPGDAAVVAAGAIEQDRIGYAFTATGMGPDQANDVRLRARLPDVGRPWHVDAASSQGCELTGLELLCRLGDLGAGESETVQASALHCPQDCGDDAASEARISAINDPVADNDVAQALVLIPDCPTAAEPAPSDAPSSEANGTQNEGANESVGSDSGPAPSDGGNQSGQSTARSPDVRVGLVPTQDDVEALLTIRVVSLGPDAAQGVVLRQELPDVRRPWYLAGPDAADCLLDGRTLTCSFGTLGAGESRVVTTKAFTDRIACGHHLVATATVEAFEDVNPANDGSSAGIEAPAC